MPRKLTPAKVYADLERAEKRLSLAFTKWTKARATAKRMDAKLDKESLPGEMDVRKMPIEPRPWPGRGARPTCSRHPSHYEPCPLCDDEKRHGRRARV